MESSRQWQIWKSLQASLLCSELEWFLSIVIIIECINSFKDG